MVLTLDDAYALKEDSAKYPNVPTRGIHTADCAMVVAPIKSAWLSRNIYCHAHDTPVDMHASGMATVRGCGAGSTLANTIRLYEGMAGWNNPGSLLEEGSCKW